MVQLIVGNKGKGKTKVLLERANEEIKKTSGNIVYLDKSTKHMYELNNKIRLINVLDYSIDSSDAFVGFISGIIAADHDLEQIYFDSFLSLACLEGQDYEETLKKLEDISNKFNIILVLTLTSDMSALSDEIKSKVIVSL